MYSLSVKTFSACAVILCSLAVQGHNKPGDQGAKLDDMIKSADAVVVGKVVGVQYAISSDGQRESETLPHTFVTYEVSRILKGSPQQSVITMRFLGGRGKESDFMMVHNSPLFSTGNEDILFVRGNQRAACPLVGCGEGRFRIINGMAYSDVGQQIVLTKRQMLGFGQYDILQEIMSHQVSQTTIHRKIVTETGEGKPEQGLPIGTHLRGAGLIDFIQQRVLQLDPNRQWERLPPIVSANIQLPFTINLPKPTKAKKAREIPVRKQRQTPAEILEENLFKRNDGNPVIRQ